jgi:hypothetical protein
MALYADMNISESHRNAAEYEPTVPDFRFSGDIHVTVEEWPVTLMLLATQLVTVSKPRLCQYKVGV